MISLAFFRLNNEGFYAENFNENFNLKRFES